MTDANNEAVKPSGEDSKPQGQGQPPEDDGASSSNANVDPAEQARRDQQSKKDKAVSQNSDLEETVEFLHGRELERARDEHVSGFLKEHADKYPNVKPNDPMFKYATSKEDVEEIATNLQNTFSDMQQDALLSVQTESERSLTDEEIATKETELEKEAQESGKSQFGTWIGTIGRRKKA